MAAGPTYYHTDALGSPVVQTDATGQEIAGSRRHYEPYGQLLSDLVPADQGPGYTGHVTDVLTGFSYMQQRYYDPLAGRFLSVDPVVANATDGSNFNRYWYANNNPYRYIDPDGRAPDTDFGLGAMAQYFGGHPDEARPLVPFAAAGIAIAAAPVLLSAGEAAFANLPATINAVNAIAEIGAGDALGGASLTVGGAVLYRVADKAELASIMKLGRFSASPNGDNVKRFLEKLSDAKALKSRFDEVFGIERHIVKGSAPAEVMKSAEVTRFSDVPGGMNSVNVPSRLVDKVICTGAHLKKGGC